MQSLRKLQSDVSVDRASIYAFKADGNAVCVLLSGRGGTCPTPTKKNPAGVLWMVSGGVPEWASKGGLAIPSVLFGLVADNVRRISYVDRGAVDRGRERPLAIRDNIFVTEFPQEPRGLLLVEFVNGRRGTIAIPPR